MLRWRSLIFFKYYERRSKRRTTAHAFTWAEAVCAPGGSCNVPSAPGQPSWWVRHESFEFSSIEFVWIHFVETEHWEPSGFLTCSRAHSSDSLLVCLCILLIKCYIHNMSANLWLLFCPQNDGFNRIIVFYICLDALASRSVYTSCSTVRCYKSSMPGFP